MVRKASTSSGFRIARFAGNLGSHRLADGSVRAGGMRGPTPERAMGPRTSTGESSRRRPRARNISGEGCTGLVVEATTASP